MESREITPLAKNNMTNNIFATRDADTGTTINTFATFEEAERAVAQYENDDIEEGTYEDGFYEVYNTETEEAVRCWYLGSKVE